ncbi:MAG: tetratricopeptide repeat protein [Myxococcales bacterium]|nr:tetratricopeptide repeat protein [Myxococcales bacterium]
MMRKRRSITVVLALGLVLSACKNQGKDSDNPDELELPPETKVADTKGKDGSKAGRENKGKDEGKKPIQQQPKPPIVHPQDRDPKQEKTKMERSRITSAKAKQLLRGGQNDKAIDEARKALREHEQNVEAMLVIAEAFYKQGKHELVQSVTGSILKVDEKILTPEEKSQAYNLMGFAYLQAGSRGEAYKAFKNAAEADDHNASAWNNLGVQYMWRNDSATAETCFEYAVGLDPKFADAQLNWGAALRANGKISEAESAFQAASKLRPDWPEVHFNLGVLYLDAPTIGSLDTTGRLNAAIKEFEQYKSLSAKGKSTLERSSKKKRGPTDAMGNELVSVAQADLYIKAANKSIESEKRRLDREQRRKDKETAKQEEEQGGSEPAPQEPAPQEPAPQEPAPKQDPAPQEPAPKQDPPQEPAPKEDPAPQDPKQPQQPQKPQPQKPQPQKPTPQKPGAGG